VAVYGFGGGDVSKITAPRSKEDMRDGLGTGARRNLWVVGKVLTC
jgi:hypothetical protein